MEYDRGDSIRVDSVQNQKEKLSTWPYSIIGKVYGVLALHYSLCIPEFYDATYVQSHLELI